ncbi:MAG TPA: hypothetical protein VGE37_09945, partial [Archangium sp.]
MRLDATLHDLRVSADDELVAFRQVMSFSSPERARALLELQDERLELELYELFANRDGGLDLHVALSLPREDFERCVTQPRGACDLLSLIRLDGMQRVDEAFVGWEDLTEFPVPPRLDSSELRALAER